MDTAHDADRIERSPRRERRAFRLIVLYLFLEFGRPQDLLPGLSVLHLPGLVMALLAFQLVTEKRLNLSDRQTTMFMMLVGLMLFHVPLATNNHWAFFTTLTMVQILIAYLAIVTVVTTPEKLAALVRSWLLIHVWLAVVGIWKGGRGVGGFLGDENDFSMTLNMALPFAFFATMRETDRSRQLIYGATAALFLFANVLTLSRGGFLGLVAVAMYCWLRSPRKIVSTAFIGLLAAIIVGGAPPKYWDEIQSIQRGTDDPTGKTRKYFWEIGWSMFLGNPIIGVGQGNFPYRFREYEIASGSEDGLEGTSGAGRAAHSLYFTLLPELGFVGAALWSLMLIATVKDLRRVRRTSRPQSRFWYLSTAMEASLIGYLVSGVFISVLYYPSFWILSAFVIALRNAASSWAEQPAGTLTADSAPWFRSRAAYSCAGEHP